MFATRMNISIVISLALIWSPACDGHCGFKDVAEIKKSFKDNIQHCMADCLKLTNDATKKDCSFNSINGKVKGCDARLSIKQSKFKVVCNIDLDHVWNDTSLLSAKGQSLCDIVIISVAAYNATTNQLEMKSNRWSSGRLVMKMAKKFGISVILRVGTWDEWVMHPKDITKVAKNAQLTEKFAESVADLVKKYDFGGIIISWMWPGCPQSNCVQDVDRKTVVNFIRAVTNPIRQEDTLVLYHVNGYYVSTVMAGGDYFSDVMDDIDYFYFESHLQSGDWSATAEFSFNLKKTKDLISELTNKIKRSVEFKRKLIISVDAIFFNFEISDPTVMKLGTTFVKDTKREKTLRMPQWCKLMRDPAYKLVKNPETQNYAVKPKNIFIFDDQESLTAKINFVMEFGAGVGIHNLGNDDINGECGCGRLPFLRHIVTILKSDCQPIPCF